VVKKALTIILIALGMYGVGGSLCLLFFSSSPATVIGGSSFFLLVLIGGLLLRKTQKEPRTRPRVLVIVSVVALGVGFAMPFLLAGNFSEDETTAWTYRLEHPGFRLTLPSGDWKEVSEKGFAAAFHNPRHSVRVVVHARKESREDFESKSVKQLTSFLSRSSASMLSPLPSPTVGTTAAGGNSVYWLVITRGEGGSTFFSGFGVVWCKEQSVTLNLLYEGRLTMRSRLGKEREDAYHKSSFRKIFLSAQ
jgi:hypothetical protein